LITSRSYFNFTKITRKGDTVKTFNPSQSWDLLLKFLGPTWQTRDTEGLIPESESKAAKVLLEKIGGLALAIEQTATLIKDKRLNGISIAGFLDTFNECSARLRRRPRGERGDLVHALDTIWSIAFDALSTNARSLLGVLGLLSPDVILIDLFLPRNQRALNGILTFCKKIPADEDGQQVALSTITTPSPALDEAIRELKAANLIKQDGRVLSIHRVVQEALNYMSLEDIQDYFNAVVQLVFEAFPRQMGGEPLLDQWSKCEDYIQHGIHLADKYVEILSLNAEEPLKPSEEFTFLLGSCAW
jgi:hypothetical protein